MVFGPEAKQADLGARNRSAAWPLWRRQRASHAARSAAVWRNCAAKRAACRAVFAALVVDANQRSRRCRGLLEALTELVQPAIRGDDPLRSWGSPAVGIEHCLFAFITQSWRGKPLLTHQVIVQLIASTTTDKGLTVQCRLDENAYTKGIKVPDAEMATLNITPAEFHGEWNYTINPRKPQNQHG